MEELDEYKFGNPYGEKIPIEKAVLFAKKFGEGSPALTKLIEYCILNEIITYSSCKGHPERRNVLERVFEKGHITFRFDMYYDKDDFAYFLASIPSINKKISAYLESNYEADRTITFYVPARKINESEEYFEFILDQLKKYKQMKENGLEININQKIKKIVDYIFYSWNEYESFEITQSTYKKFIREGMYIKKISSCPSNEKTNNLHAKFGAYLQNLRKDNIDDFINYKH